MTSRASGSRSISRWLLALLLAVLAACTTRPPQKVPAPAVAPQPGSMVREQSRWVPVAWQELPGWHADAVHSAWPALLRSCQRALPEWQTLCGKVLQVPPPADDGAWRDWL